MQVRIQQLGHVRRRLLIGVCAAAAAASTVTAVGGEDASAALTVRVVNTGGDGIASRSAPSLTATNGYGAPEGATVTTICWTWGPAVGPYSNRLWWKIAYSGRQFYAADRYQSTPTVANVPPPGEPGCSTPPPPPPPPPAAPPVWVGAPFAGRWVPVIFDCPPADATPTDTCSMPGYHHFLNTWSAPAADWAVDLGAPAGTSVKVFAAPRTAGTPVVAKVERVRPACTSRDLALGGHAVTVAFYSGAIRVGSATYAHIRPSVTEGQTISRWGAVVGTVGRYAKNGCWDGDHLHFQMESTRNFACFNGSWRNQAQMSPTNFLGYTGGNFAQAVRRRCP